MNETDKAILEAVKAGLELRFSWNQDAGAVVIQAEESQHCDGVTWKKVGVRGAALSQEIERIASFLATFAAKGK